MHIKRLINTKDLSKEDWLKIRKEAGISGTQISAIAGMNKYSSPMQVYLEKTSDEIIEIPDNDYMLFGRLLEPVVADEFARRNPGYKVKRINAILQHPEHEWAIGDIDRLVTNENGEQGILEIKTCSEYSKADWDGQNCPVGYLIQLQWYLFITGADYGIFAILAGGNTYMQKYVKRDDELINMLLTMGEDFWFNNVKKEVPPAIDGTDATEEVLIHMYPESNGNEIQLCYSALELIQARSDLKQQIKELTEKCNEFENKLKDTLKESEIGTVDKYKVTWKTTETNRFDSKRFRIEQPALYEKYITKSNTRRFDIREIKLKENN